MADIFISYSRKNIAFAKILVQAAHDQGLDLWIDWEDIPPSVDWMSEINSAIETADTFVFIVSKVSAQSDVCGKEISHAVKLGKRIIPIIVEDVDPGSLPQAISSINWVDFREGNPFQKAFDQLLSAIKMDLDWAREHTRILVRALEWEKASRDRSYLLHGRELQTAEKWVNEEVEDRMPQLTRLQHQYLLASRQNANRRTRLTMMGALGILSILLLLSVGVLIQKDLATRSENLRATAQANAEMSKATALAEKTVRATAEANAQYETKIALSRELAERATNLSGNEPRKLTLATLLAIESLSQVETYEGATALRKALSFLPEPVAHLKIIPGRTFAADDSNPITALKFSSDGKKLAIGTEKETISILDVASWTEIMHVESRGIPRNASITSLDFSPDSRYLVSGDAANNAIVWDTVKGIRFSSFQHSDSVETAAFTPDGKRIISATSSDIVIWNPQTGMEFNRLPIGAYLLDIRQDGKICASASSTDVYVWEVETGKIITKINRIVRKPGDITEIRSLQLSPDGKFLASALGESQSGWILPRPSKIGGEIMISDPMTGKTIATMNHKDSVETMVFNSDGTRLITGSLDRSVKIWDTATGTLQKDLIFTAGIGAVAIGKDDGWIATSESGGIIRIWEPFSGKVINYLTSDDGKDMEILEISPDGKFLAASTENGVYIWRVIGSELVAMKHGSNLTIQDARFSPDGKRLLTAAWDGKVRLWNVDTGEKTQEIKHSGQASTVVFDPSGKFGASADRSGQVKIFKIDTGEELFSLPEYEGISQIGFSPDGKLLAIAVGVDQKLGWQTYHFQKPKGSFHLWSLETKTEIAEFSHPDVVNGFAFTKDSGSVLTTCGDGLVRTWNVAQKKVVSTNTFGQNLNFVLVSPQGDLAAAVESCLSVPMGSNLCSPLLKVWNLESGKVLWQTHLVGTWVSAMKFNPDGKSLALANMACHSDACSNEVLIFDTLSGHVLQEKWYEPTFLLFVLEFNKDGSLIASGGGPPNDGWVDIWDPHTGVDQTRLFFQQPMAGSFSPINNSFAIVGNQSGPSYAKIYPLDTRSLIQEACKRLQRNLTDQEWKTYLGILPYKETCPLKGSVSDDPNGKSYKPRLSKNGSDVFFFSESNNLACQKTGTGIGIYKYDISNHKLALVKQLQMEGDKALEVFSPSVSTDGRYFLFSTNADNLGFNDTNQKPDVFLYDALKREFTLISQSMDGQAGNDYTRGAIMTDDAHYIAFESVSSNLIPGDTNGEFDIFLKDRSTGQLIRIVPPAENLPEKYYINLLGFNHDQSALVYSVEPKGENVEKKISTYAYFIRDQKTEEYKEPFPFQADWTYGSGLDRTPDGSKMVGIKYAEVDGSKTAEWQLDLVTLIDYVANSETIITQTSTGEMENHDSQNPSITADGSTVVFSSEADNLTQGINNFSWNIFSWNAKTDKVERIIKGLNGAEPNGHSLNASISGDGRLVVFDSTASNLVPGDHNQARDVFLFNVFTGRIVRMDTAIPCE